MDLDTNLNHLYFDILEHNFQNLHRYSIVFLIIIFKYVQNFITKN